MQHWMQKRKTRRTRNQRCTEQPVFWIKPTPAHDRFVALLLKRTQTAAVMLIVCAMIYMPAVAETTDKMTEIRPEQVASGSLLLRMPVQTAGAYRVAPRLNTEIDLSIVADIARARVIQTFENPTGDWVEAIYVFPLPDDAAVDHMTLQIGERRIVGEVHRKATAKQIYATAKREGKKAALLSQERPNLFTTAVANIGPHQRVVVEIEYQQSVQQDGQQFSLRIPLTLTPRFIPGTALQLAADRQGSGWSTDTDVVPDASRITPQFIESDVASKDHKVNLTASIDAGHPLLSLESRYHKVVVTPAAGDRYDLILDNKFEIADHDVELQWILAPAVDAVAAQFVHQTDADTYLLTRLLPPDIEPVAVTAPRELVLLVDTSGSMGGVSIEQARSAAQFAVWQLRSDDYFNVIEFNDTASPLFGHSQPASDENKREAMQWLAALNADGGTNMSSALALALKDDGIQGLLRQVLFVTDGAVGNEEQLFSQINRDLGRSRLFTVGIGSAPNGWFMRKAAEVGRGTQTTISAVGDVELEMQALFSKLTQPALTDISLDWQGIAVEHYPQVISDLYAGEPINIVARVSAGALPDELTMTATQWRNGKPAPWTHTLPLGADDNSGDSGIAVTWARRKIESLADQRRRGAARHEINNKIAEVALAHHLVSEQTSLVAVDTTPARSVADALQSRNVANLLPYGSAKQSMAALVPTATPAALKQLLGALMILLALVGLALSRARSINHVLF